MKELAKCLRLTRYYEQGDSKFYALKNVDLTLIEGEFSSICGPSGSGKTTLLNLIGGLDRASEGYVEIDGVRVDKLSSGEKAELRLNKLGFIFQAYNLVPVLSAIENVEFVMQLQGVKPKERREKSIQILKDVGLDGMENRRPGELSGGQQQRVAVARAIVTNPKLVLADEPTANLDSNTSEKLIELMKEMNQKRGVSFLFSTHDKLVMKHAKKLIKLKDGEIEEIVE